MNDDTLVAIQCYAGDVHQVNRALSQYMHHGCPVLILSPTDEPALIEFPGVECQTAGLDAYIGPESLERHRAQLDVLAEHSQRWILLHESDSMCLDPWLPSYLYEDDALVWGNSLDTREHIDRSDDPDPDGTHARLPIALQAPWFFSHDALELMLEVFDESVEELPDYAKFIDWWFVVAAEKAGLELRTFPDGISTPIWHPDEIERARSLVFENGVVMVHSVKDAGALGSLITARLMRT